MFRVVGAAGGVLDEPGESEYYSSQEGYVPPASTTRSGVSFKSSLTDGVEAPGTSKGRGRSPGLSEARRDSPGLNNTRESTTEVVETSKGRGRSPGLVGARSRSPGSHEAGDRAAVFPGASKGRGLSPGLSDSGRQSPGPSKGRGLSSSPVKDYGNSPGLPKGRGLPPGIGKGRGKATGFIVGRGHAPAMTNAQEPTPGSRAGRQTLASKENVLSVDKHNLFSESGDENSGRVLSDIDMSDKENVRGVPVRLRFDRDPSPVRGYDYVQDLKHKLNLITEERDAAQHAAEMTRCRLNNYEQLAKQSEQSQQEMQHQLQMADLRREQDQSQLRCLQDRLQALELQACRPPLSGIASGPGSFTQASSLNPMCSSGGERKPRSERRGRFSDVESSSSDCSTDRSRRSVKVWRRHFKRPDPFTGEPGESWSAWQTNFERKLTFAAIDDDFDRVVYFSDSIKGTALRFYNSNLSDREQSSWKLCKRRFQARFGPPAENTVGRAELASMTLRKGESAMAFCQRFIEAWEKVYTSVEVSTSSRDPYMVEQFISAIGDEQAIVHVGCQPHETLDEVCRSLQQWLNANSFAGTQKGGNLRLKNKNELRVPELPVYSNVEEPLLGMEAIMQPIKSLQKTVDSLKQSVQQGARPKSRGKVDKRSGDEISFDIVTRLPSWTKEYKLVGTPRRGCCWFCGEKAKPTKHNLKTCPKRLEMEKKNPGSTFKRGRRPQKKSEN